jgi:adenylate cyclase
MPDPDLPSAVLQFQGVEYALCNGERRILEHSPGLPRLVTEDKPPASLVGWRLEELFVEFMGAETSLVEGTCADEPCFQLMHVYRENLAGRPGYLTITVVGYSSGLLLMVEDATREGELARKLMQRRNEVLLLQEQLQAANARLEYLLHHFVPASVARRTKAQFDLPTPGGQCRIATVLFADVRGYTALAEALEPEVVLNLLNQYFTIVGSLVTEYGGTICQYAGDQIMVVFNAPDDQPDHAVRAATAALDIQVALTNLRCHLSESGQKALVHFGIGINTGSVVSGYLGFKDRFDYTAVGDTTNVAARLSSAAQPGEVLIGPQTYEAVHQHVRTELVGSLPLRGRAGPIMVYRALT